MTPADASEHREEFCARLKHEREQRAVSLAQIADQTKIKASLLASLERGDLSRWPKGIYRRAFFRDYALAVGLPLETYTTEFLRLFGERDQIAALDKAGPVAPAAPSRVALPLAAAPTVPAPPGPGLSFRLTFGDAGAPRGTAASGRSSSPRRATSPATPADLTSTPMRLALGLFDIALVLALSLAIASVTGKLFWQVSSIVAMLHLGVSAFAARTPATWLFVRTAALAAARGSSSTVAGAEPWRERVEALGPQLSQRFRASKEYLERLAYGVAMTRGQRRRDLMGMRRRRVEAANASAVDEAGGMV